MISIKPTAVDEFRRRLNSRGTPNSSIRIGVRGGGCSGYTLSISFEDQPNQRDHAWVVNDVSFVIDPKSMIFLSGSTIVWKESLSIRGFDIENPNETSRCGCGHSFTVR